MKEIVKRVLLFGDPLTSLLLLGGSLLGWLLGLLCGRLLLGLNGLGSLWFLSELEGSSSLLTSSSSSDDSLGGDQLLQGEPDTSSSLGSVHLVVSTDVLQDGLTGGALLVSEGLDGGLDHGAH